MRVRRLRSPALTYDKSCRAGQLGGRPGGSLTPNCGYRDNDNGASRARKSIWDGFTNVISELGENIRAGSSMSSARWCGYHRKAALRLLNRPKASRPKRRPWPKRVYDPAQVLGQLKRIWLASEQPCSKRLKAALPLSLPHLKRACRPRSARICWR